MNRIMKYVSVSVVALLCYACNEALTEELFEKHVLLTKNGWIEQNIDITESEQFELSVAVSINGTAGNDRNVTVFLKFDPENLEEYNFERYRRADSLYYRELPANALAFKSNNQVSIPGGDIRGISYLSLDISKLDNIYDDYVIPVSIDSVSEYKKAVDYHKALYHIVLKNKYSGNYTGQLGVYRTNRTGANIGEPIPVTTKTLYATGKQQGYFYAAHYDRSEAERNKYIVTFSVDENDSIHLTALDPALELVQEKAVISSVATEDRTDNRYRVVSTEINLSYKITLPLLSPDFPLRVEGKVTKNERVLINQ